MQRPDGTESAPTRHVVCFEEAGECALERVVREARVGDSVLVLGPEAWAMALRRMGLPAEVGIDSVGRVGSRWRAGDLPKGLEAGVRLLAYGPQAARIVGCSALTQPGQLPATPVWPEGRRARIRRELGLSQRDRALLIAGDPSEWIDVSFIARAVGMAIVGGALLRIVASPRVPRLSAIDAFLAGAVGSSPLVVDVRADTPWEVLPALDGAIIDGDGAAERPVECAGWRTGGWRRDAWRVSPLPATWALACGVPAFVHESVDLGAHAAHPLAKRFGRDVAAFARLLL